MADIDSTLMQLPNLTDNGNKVKDTVLSRLVTDKIITENQFKEYTEKWQVIVIKKSWFSRWFKVFGKESKDADAYQFKYVRFED